MSRAVDLWVGKTDDTPAPPRVRVRVFDREHGRCHRCTRLIRAGETWTLEHRVALINGGANAEDNMCLTCCNCLPIKNAEDQALKSDTYDKRRKHILPKAKGKMRSRGFGYSPPNVKQLEEL